MHMTRINHPDLRACGVEMHRAGDPVRAGGVAHHQRGGGRMAGGDELRFPCLKPIKCLGKRVRRRRGGSSGGPATCTTGSGTVNPDEQMGQTAYADRRNRLYSIQTHS